MTIRPAKRWLDTETVSDAEARSLEFWDGLKKDGLFWADAIKEYKDCPPERLEIALNHLPLPRAFNEAAIAIRAIIKGKRKVGDGYEEELALLYRLAAIRSFALDYAPRLKEPGFNVFETIPGKQISSLKFSYDGLGYEKLRILNKTDHKWMVERWGEPKAHSTLHEMYKHIWDAYESRLIEKRKINEKRFWKDLIEECGTARQRRSNLFGGWMIVIILSIFIIAIYLSF